MLNMDEIKQNNSNSFFLKYYIGLVQGINHSWIWSKSNVYISIQKQLNQPVHPRTSLVN